MLQVNVEVRPGKLMGAMPAITAHAGGPDAIINTVTDLRTRRHTVTVQMSHGNVAGFRRIQGVRGATAIS